MEFQFPTSTHYCFTDSNKRPTCLARIDNITSNNNTTNQSIGTTGTPITASMIAVSFTDGSIDVYDLNSLESSSSSINNSPTPFITFKQSNESTNSSDSSNVTVNNQSNTFGARINSIVVHPTMPILVSAHRDRQIKFWDLNTGKNTFFKIL